MFLFPFIRFNVCFRDWSPYAAKFIFRQICEKGHQLSDDPVQKINSICQKTVEDLRVILNDMEEFQSKVVPEDQNKRKLFHCWKRNFKWHLIYSLWISYPCKKKPPIHLLWNKAINLYQIIKIWCFQNILTLIFFFKHNNTLYTYRCILNFRFCQTFQTCTRETL